MSNAVNDSAQLPDAATALRSGGWLDFFFMTAISTHFEQLMSREEQERIGATPDKSEHLRVMRTLCQYELLRQALHDLVEAERATMDQFTTAEIKALEAALSNAKAALGSNNLGQPTAPHAQTQGETL